MISQTNSLQRLAIDVQGQGDLQRAARQNSPEALKTVAKQFEALFISMMMKSMREATPQDGVFDSDQSRMYTAMLDQQLSQNMASRGIGLADVLVRQLSVSQAMSEMPAGAGDLPLLQGPQHLKDGAPLRAARSADTVQAFLQRVEAHAEEASRTTGIPAKFIIGQAALESGWGKHEIQDSGGVRSHNLFGIKATGDWKGRVTEAVTTEYVNGVPQRRIEKFRAYDSYADAFRDYGSLLRNNPRYKNVIANAQDAVSFAQNLQRAGYATDPQYAAKLSRIIQQMLV